MYVTWKKITIYFMVMYYQKNSDEDIPINFSLLETPEKVLGQQ